MCSLPAGCPAVARRAAGGPGFEPGTALLAPRHCVERAGSVTKAPPLRDVRRSTQAFQRQSHHAGAAVRVAVGGPYRRAPDGEGCDVVRADVGADPAGPLGCAEQFVEGLAEPSRRRGQARPGPACLRGQGVACVLAAAGLVDDLQEESEERGGRIDSGRPLPSGLHQVVELLDQHGLQQDLLAGEVPVHGAGCRPPPDVRSRRARRPDRARRTPATRRRAPSCGYGGHRPGRLSWGAAVMSRNPLSVPLIRVEHSTSTPGAMRQYPPTIPGRRTI